METRVFEFNKKFHIIDKNALKYADKIGDFLREQLLKSGREGYVLGLSGGLDSAVAAYLCKRAGLNLYIMMLPYGDTMKNTGSAKRAQEVIENLGLGDKTVSINIKPFCDIADLKRAEYAQIYPNPKMPQNLKLAAENRRARQRMIELYDFAQAHRLLVLGTGNLDEYCLGYFTKYGDGASDVEPLMFCLKNEVRTLGEALGVPESILTCAPSAELSDGQTDEEDLGFGYDCFDRFAITGTSNVPAIDQKIIRRYESTKHKRQFPPAFNG